MRKLILFALLCFILFSCTKNATQTPTSNQQNTQVQPNIQTTPTQDIPTQAQAEDQLASDMAAQGVDPTLNDVSNALN